MSGGAAKNSDNTGMIAGVLIGIFGPIFIGVICLLLILRVRYDEQRSRERRAARKKRTATAPVSGIHRMTTPIAVTIQDGPNGVKMATETGIVTANAAMAMPPVSATELEFIPVDVATVKSGRNDKVVQ